MWNPSTASCATRASTPRSSPRSRKAQILVDRWRREYNQVRPHSALGYRPPAPETLEVGPPHPTPLADRMVLALT